MTSVRFRCRSRCGNLGLRGAGVALALLAPLLSAACDSRAILDPAARDSPSRDAELRRALALSSVSRIGAIPAPSQPLVELGRALFFDKILSGNRDVSCATCHDPSLSSGDGLTLSIGTAAVIVGSSRVLGLGRQYVPRNSPSLLNQALGLSSLFWDARVAEGAAPGEFRSPAGAALPSGLASVLAAQAMFPVTNRTEMRGDPGDRDVLGGSNELAAYGDAQWSEIWSAVMRRVLAIEEYRTGFGAAYPSVAPSRFGFEHAANAIAAFEAQAFTHLQSPFDRYVSGQDDALSEEAKRGALLFFTERRCSGCHFGTLLGSTTFAATGVPQLGPGVGDDAPLDRGMPVPFPGQTRFVFRVPPLRNVELSAPYMHDGAYATLAAVVRHYSDVEQAVRTYDAGQVDPALRATYHGEPATVGALLGALDNRLRRPFGFRPEEQAELVAFLRSLTDPSARDLSVVIPASVPSGLPVR